MLTTEEPRVREDAPPGSRAASGDDVDPQPSGLRWDWFVAVLVSITTWTDINRVATPWVDDSWRYTLLHAASEGLDFGSDVAFTYGPLVFLDGGPMYTPLTGAGAFLVRLALGTVCALLFLRVTRRFSWARWQRALGAWLTVAALVPPDRFGETVALATCGWLLYWLINAGSVPRPATLGIAVLAGVWLNVKPSAALVTLAAVTIASLPGPSVADPSDRGSGWWAAARRGTAPLVTAGATMVMTWLIAGQQLGSLRQYFGDWLEVSGGFAGGMAHPTRQLFVVEVLLALFALALTVKLVQRALAARTPATTAAALLCVGVMFWVRQVAMARADGNHMKDAGVAVALLTIAAWPQIGRRFGGVIIASSLALTAALALQPIPALTETVPVVGSMAHFGSDSVNLLRGGRPLVDENRSFLAEVYALPDPILETIGNETVHISPQDTNVAFAYPDMGFWLMPNVQAYSSYTADLEERSASAVTGPDGPAFVLHRPYTTVDFHRPAWDSPALNHAYFCSFDPVIRTDEWSVLERRDQGCAPPVTLADPVPAAAVVAIPPSARECEGIVTFRIHGAERTGADRLVQLFLRQPRPFVTTQGLDWPVIPATASEPHIIAAPRSDLVWLGEDMPSPATLLLELEIDDLEGYVGPSETPTIQFECWSKGPGG